MNRNHRWGLLTNFVPLLALFVVGVLVTNADGFAVVKHKSALIRTGDMMENVRIDPKGRFFTYTEKGTLGLKLMDSKTNLIFQITKNQVGSSYFWSPNGFRVFYRELIKNKKGQIKSRLMAYDCALKKNVELETFPYRTGILTFDPRDLRMQILAGNGIKTKKVYFPEQRLARWQVAQRTQNGKWLATQKGILWVTQGGFTMRRMEDGGGRVTAFDVSPDGSAIVWSTDKIKVFFSRDGQKPKFMGFGQDPKWHPTKPLALFAGARMVGNKPIGYDLKVADTRGVGRFLTNTQNINERWPNWYADAQQIVYTRDKTANLYVTDFR